MELLYIAYQPDEVTKKDRKESPLPHHPHKHKYTRQHNMGAGHVRDINADVGKMITLGKSMYKPVNFVECVLIERAKCLVFVHRLNSTLSKILS